MMTIAEIEQLAQDLRDLGYPEDTKIPLTKSVVKSVKIQKEKVAKAKEAELKKDKLANA